MCAPNTQTLGPGRKCLNGEIGGGGKGLVSRGGGWLEGGWVL